MDPTLSVGELGDVVVVVARDVGDIILNILHAWQARRPRRQPACRKLAAREPYRRTGPAERAEFRFSGSRPLRTSFGSDISTCVYE